MDNSKTPNPGELNVKPMKKWKYGRVPIISCPCDAGLPSCSVHKTPDKTEPTAQPIKEYCKECGQKEGYGHLDHCNKRQTPPPAQVEKWDKQVDIIFDELADKINHYIPTEIIGMVKSTLQKAVEEAVTERDKKWVETNRNSGYRFKCPEDTNFNEILNYIE